MGRVEANRECDLEKELFVTLSAPVTVQLELTSACNENCVHCYNYWLRNRDRSNRLAVPASRKGIIAQAVDQIITNKVLHATLTGGEPFLGMENAYPHLTKLHDSGVGMSINTNLTLFDQKKSEQLKGLGINSILTSMMSCDPRLNDHIANRQGTLRDTVRGIELAVKEGYWVGVNMVVSKLNYRDIFKTAVFVKSLGVTNFSATKASTPSNSENFERYALTPEEARAVFCELIRIEKDLKMTTDSLEFYPMCMFDDQESRNLASSRSCSAGRTACTIGFDGSVRPCSHASHVYGSVCEPEGLKLAWKNLRPWRTYAYIPDGCVGCNYLSSCRGGCRTEAYARFGSLKAPDPYCRHGVNPLPVHHADQFQSTVKTRFGIRGNLKYRDEFFGGIVFAAPSRWAALDARMYNFFMTRRQQEFQVTEIMKILQTDSIPSALQTLAYLAQKSLIYERR